MTPFRSSTALFTAFALLLSRSSFGDEGMWTFDNFPRERLKAEQGFSPDAKWLEDVRSSSLRIANGCSASFVSKTGLVMTNHHCVVDCVQQISTAEDNLVDRGFLAASPPEERRCPAMEINQLVGIEDVTLRINEATKDLEGQAFIDARKAEIATVEKACGGDSESVRCDVVTLYDGGLYHLYRYRRFQDVRLVFAPSVDIAFFGGDPDNFNFPRYVLDAAFLRVYEGSKPHRPKNYFRWSKQGANEGDLVFVSGHPGSTSRLSTVAELRYWRDIGLPERIYDLAEELGLLHEFARGDEERTRIANFRRSASSSSPLRWRRPNFGGIKHCLRSGSSRRWSPWGCVPVRRFRPRCFWRSGRWRWSTTCCWRRLCPSRGWRRSSTRCCTRSSPRSMRSTGSVSPRRRGCASASCRSG
ncbi:MAG: S46 family peptidase [Myxococcales bacterium]|nr:S46 family peptidase [Myxococcales bacterium]